MNFRRPLSLARRLLPTATALALIAGAVGYSARQADQGLRANLLQQTRIAAKAIRPQEAAVLTGTPADLSSTHYRELKNQLAAIRSADPKIRFLYLMERNPAGEIVFLVDNEAETSPDCSPPGQIYGEASATLRSAFEKEQGTVDGPERDHWGTWVSGFVPLSGREFGNRLVLLGMDVDARDWRRDVSIHAALPAALAILAILLAWGSVLLHQNRREIRARQAELEKKQSQLQELIDFLPDATLAIDNEKRIVIWNQSIEKMTGIRAAEMIGKGNYAYSIPFYGEPRPQLMDLVFESPETLAARYPLIAREGDTLVAEVFCGALYNRKGAWISVKASPLHDPAGNIIGAIESLRDITARKRAEEALSLALERYDLMAKQNHSVTWEIDLQGLYLRLSDETLDTAQYRPEELTRKTYFYNLHPEKGREEFKATVLGHVRRGEQFQNVVHPVTTKSGGIAWFVSSAIPMRDAQGNLCGAWGTSTDITERKRSEDQVLALLAESTRARQALLGILEDEKRVRDELERRIAELDHAQTALVRSEKLASLGKLVSEVAHEISNPLMIISCNAQLALMPEIGAEEAGELLRTIGNECQRAKAILKRLLHFSAPGKGQSKPVDLNASLEGVAGMLENQLKWSHIEIRRTYAERLPPASIDEPRMQEVFMNLINNAREAMPNGGTLFLTTSLEGDWIRLDFRDTGAGIPEGARESIFEPFFTTKEEGAGLGLPVSYAIVKAHGGEINFASQPNAGTTFTIRLPAAKAAPPARATQETGHAIQNTDDR